MDNTNGYKTGTLVLVEVKEQPEIGIAQFIPTGIWGVLIPAEEKNHARIHRDVLSQIMVYADGTKDKFVFYQPIIVCDDQIGDHEPYYSKRQNLIFDGGTNHALTACVAGDNFKVLVLTKNLSNHFLQKIVDKEYKEGDKFEVRLMTVVRDTSELVGMDGHPNGLEPQYTTPEFNKDGTVTIRPFVDIQAIFKESQEKSHRQFEIYMLEKRSHFHELIHATFVLNTSISKFGILTEEQKSWLAYTYPNSEIKTGNDQGAQYYTITPKF